MRISLEKILYKYPEDITAIRNIIAITYSRVNPDLLHKALEETFETTSFDFDRTTLNRLRSLREQSKIETELAQIMRPHIKLVDNVKSINNIYVACSLSSNVERPQCVNKKLVMTAERFDPYISILASDILNPLKTTILGTMTSGIVDGARFITRLGERINIR